MSNVSRNAPCPCGSGKKYKHCCLNKNPSPLELLTPQKLKELGVRTEEPFSNFAHDQTLMESLGSPNSATDAINQVKKQLENQSLGSIDEAQELISKQFNQQNATGLNDFLGLSPNQMSELMSGNSGIFSFNKNISTHFFDKSIPIINWADHLLKELDKFENGIKLTKKGNLPLTIVVPFHKENCRDEAGYEYPPRSEEEVPRLETTRVALKSIGYIKTLNGKLSLTKKGKKYLSAPNRQLLFEEIYEFFTNKFNWIYPTRLPEKASFIRETYIFSLYLLHQKAQQKENGELLSDFFIKAFPSYEEEKSERSYSISRSSFKILFLDNFAVVFGLLQKQPNKDLFSDSFYKVTSFFKEYFVWHIE